MDDATFWAIVDRAWGSTGPSPEVPSADPEQLREILEGEPDDTVSAFGLRFYEEVARLNHWSIWGAGYVVNGGMGDDSFHYFRSWLIGKGRAAVEQALVDPDGLGPYVLDAEEIDNELLEYVPVEICEARGLDDPRGSYAADADADARGVPFDEETVCGDYPKLAARFGSDR